MLNLPLKMIFAALALLCMIAAATAATPAPEGAEVYILTPEDGAVVNSPVAVRFGLKGMGVAPAGVDVANTGHHHLLIDVTDLPAPGQPVPADSQHLHFGGGQTETVLELPPGKHTLQLMMGDKQHLPHQPPVVSPRITIEVR